MSTTTTPRPGRLVLLATSPRVAPGLLSWPAWEALRSGRVLTGRADHPQLGPITAAGIAVEVLDGPDQPADAAGRAPRLLAEAGAGTVVWLLAPDGEDELVGALAAASASGGAPRLEALSGSHDLPGARAIDLVAVMDRLRSPEGCPWDAEQTHASLVKYLLEEAYEVVEAIEGDADAPGEDRAALREELGDVLLQVAFHARIAEEHDADPFTFDDIAVGLVDKLIGRHPHVFGATHAPTAEHVEANWDRIKAVEKGRSSAVEGVPLAQPALSLAAKLVARADRAGLDVTVGAIPGGTDERVDPKDPIAVGDRLFVLAVSAQRAGTDPEEALRAAARRFRARIRTTEAAMTGTLVGTDPA